MTVVYAEHFTWVHFKSRNNLWHRTSSGHCPQYWHSHRKRQGHRCQLCVQGFKSHCHWKHFQKPFQEPVLGGMGDAHVCVVFFIYSPSAASGRPPSEYLLWPASCTCCFLFQSHQTPFWCLSILPCVPSHLLTLLGMGPSLTLAILLSEMLSQMNTFPNAFPSLLSLFRNSCLSFNTQFRLVTSTMPSLSPYNVHHVCFWAGFCQVGVAYLLVV